MKESPKDVGASVRARLLNLAHERGDDYQLILSRYANERFLYRLAVSRHGSAFILKGATLFTIWTGHPHRTTRDVDLLGSGQPSEARIRGALAEVMALAIDDDGVTFDIDSLQVGPIREEQRYGGMRATVTARISSAKVRLQIDVGFGDAIVPKAEQVTVPALLDYPAPRLQAYPRESVVAEKLDALVQLDVANSRMKDFYDLAVIAQQFEFDGALLVRAIRATFERRGTPFPEASPIAFTAAFSSDPSKNSQWSAFVRKAGIREASDLATVLTRVAQFLAEPLTAAAKNAPWSKQWRHGGPWL